MKINNGNDLIDISRNRKMKIYQIMLEYESIKSGKTKEDIFIEMTNCLNIMGDGVEKILNPKTGESINLGGKIIGNDSNKIRARLKTHKPVCGEVMADAISTALGIMETNASMGRIVAAPTAGSCGIIPSVIFSVKRTHKLEETTLVQGLLTSSAIGVIIGKNASLSGAEGGCQAEVGSAAAMGAAGVVEMLGGSPEQCLDAAAIALKNVMGLVCDPIAGLVESPCAKRNTMGTANALICAEMALSGIKSVVPFDEVVEAMDSIGRLMPCALRETAEGGIAITPTGKRLQEEIFGSN